MRYLLFFTLFLLCFSSFQRFAFHPPKKNKQFTIFGVAQGTTYQIKYIASDSIISKYSIDSILNAIDSSLSLYKDYSIISRFNKSRKCIKIDYHFFNVVKTALQVANESNGSFDPTIKPLSNIWGFGKNKIHDEPSSRIINKALLNVNYSFLTLSSNEICKSNPHIMIDCDGIAQGYSVDIIASFFEKLGIRQYLIELGGEIKSSGTNTENQFWTVGVEDPFTSNVNIMSNQLKLQLENEAITTSGNYRKYIKLGDKYFSHIIDPKRGRPVNNGIISVSVISSDAIQADAWDNAFMILGIEKSMHIADSVNNTGVYFIYRNEFGEVKDTCNNYFKSKIIHGTS